LRLLVLTTTTDMTKSWGATPAILQLLKAIAEQGVELTVVPWVGPTSESLWWNTIPNPAEREVGVPRYSQSLLRMMLGNPVTKSSASLVLNNILRRRARSISNRWVDFFEKASTSLRPDAVMIIGIPLNDVIDLPGPIHRYLHCPVVYYLTEYETVTHVRPSGRVSPPPTDISEFDEVLTGSRGSIPFLERLKARNIHVVYFGLDPSVYVPVTIRKEVDVFFYGHGSDGRKNQIQYMIGVPSRDLPNVKFEVGGYGIEKSLVGRAALAGKIPFASMRRYVCRSNICLSITRQPLAEIEASSNVRLFELAALGACIVSDPRNGLDEWFKPNDELFVVHNSAEAKELYKWLLGSPSVMESVGQKARERFLRQHTASDRAREILRGISNLS